jgi:hypothetical protein
MEKICEEEKRSMVKLSFRREKKLQVEQQSKKLEMSELDKVCGGDKEVCRALWHTMFYDPRKIGTSMEDATKKAESFEKRGDEGQARIWYHVAGGLALWKGDVALVEEYFGKCAELAPEMEYKPITKMAEKAVEKAQQFYKEYLK